MTRSYDRYKDIPLGLIIKKDLRKRRMSQKALTHLLNLPYHFLNKVLNGHSFFSREQASAIDRFFGYEDSFSFRLQENEDIKRKEVGAACITPIAATPQVRPCVFWDTDLQSLDWLKHRTFIEGRIASHGNQEERKSILNFYAALKSS